MSLLNQSQEVSLALSETFFDGLDRVLRKLVVLNHEVMEVVTQVVCTGGPTMAVEHPEEANLGPLHIDVCLVFRLKDV